MYRLSRLLAALALLFCAAPARAQTFTNVVVPVQGQFATIVTNQKFLFYQAGATGNNVAYIMAIQPGSALTLYVTAKAATFTTSDHLSINFFTNGNPTVVGCSSGGSYVDGWTGMLPSAFINGAQIPTAGNSANITFAAATTAFVVTGILNASQVCVQISNNATGGANDTFDMYASFTPNALPTGATVGGSVINCTGGPPTVVTGANAVQPVPCDNSGNVVSGAGFYLGGQTGNGLFQDLGNWLNIFHGNAGTQTGGLGVVTTGVDNTGHARTLGVQMNQSNVSSGPPTDGALLTAGVGMTAINAAGTITSSRQTVITNTPNQNIGGIGRACTFVQTVAGPVTGTTPTLDTYVQMSPDNGTTWIDRIHFAQMTTTGNQSATVIDEPAGGIVPYVPTNQTLAASTIINGPMLPNIRIAWVTGGTTPSFGAVSIFMNCS